MAFARLRADHTGMSDRGLQRIEDDLSETWLEDWAGAGLGELEAYLAKHADFLRYLAGRETPHANE